MRRDKYETTESEYGDSKIGRELLKDTAGNMCYVHVRAGGLAVLVDMFTSTEASVTPGVFL